MDKPGFSRFVDVAVGDPMANDQLPIPYAAIEQRTDIQSRNIAGSNDTIASIGIEAGRKLFKELNIKGGDCGGLVLASCSGDKQDRQHQQENAKAIATALGISYQHQQVIATDFACTGFPKAVETGLELARETDRHILLITAEIMSRIVHWGEQSTAILFGDRAAATSIIGGGHEILDASAWEVDNPEEWLHLDAVGDAMNSWGELHQRECIRMNGKALYRHAPEAMVTLIEGSMEHLQLSLDEVSTILPHQANGRFMNKIQELLKQKRGTQANHLWIVNEIARVGNTGASSIPSAIAAVQDHLEPGKIVICPAIGAGPSFKRATISEGILTFRVSE